MMLSYAVHEGSQSHSAVHTATGDHDVSSEVQAALNGNSTENRRKRSDVSLNEFFCELFYYSYIHKAKD